MHMPLCHCIFNSKMLTECLPLATAGYIDNCDASEGKSTLMLLLFRILELDEGTISIDGVPAPDKISS